MSLVLIFELIGTVAFSASGAVVALEEKMDLFGVVIMGLTTAIGGGVLRDIILGIAPPTTFQKPIYAVTAIITAIIVFYFPLSGILKKVTNFYDRAMLIMDSVGLSVFTVVGIQIAYSWYAEGRTFLYVFVGVVTGVGGGLLRDIMAGNKPYIFVKHFYACASLSGAVLCILLRTSLGETNAMFLGATLIFILRLLAAKHRWSLPNAKK